MPGAGGSLWRSSSSDLPGRSPRGERGEQEKQESRGWKRVGKRLSAASWLGGCRGVLGVCGWWELCHTREARGEQGNRLGHQGDRSVRPTRTGHSCGTSQPPHSLLPHRFGRVKAQPRHHPGCLGGEELHRSAGTAPCCPLTSWQRAAEQLPSRFSLFFSPSPACFQQNRVRAPTSPRCCQLRGVPACSQGRGLPLSPPQLQQRPLSPAGPGRGAAGGCLPPDLGVSLMNCSCQSPVSRRKSS